MRDEHPYWKSNEIKESSGGVGRPESNEGGSGLTGRASAATPGSTRVRRWVSHAMSRSESDEENSMPSGTACARAF